VIQCCIAAVLRLLKLNMPAALDVNWDALRLAFAKGATLDELSEAFGIDRGTLGARSSREKWMELRKPADTAVQSVATLWQRRGEEAKQDWHNITKKVRKKLLDTPPEEILARAEKLKAINDIERKNLGLDQESSNPTFSVGIQLLGDSGPEMTVIEGEFEQNPPVNSLNDSDVQSDEADC
jgi:hypothetical protein